MTECERCGTDSPATVTLNHVSIQGDMFSSVRSSYTVCLACRGDLQANPQVTW